MIARQLNHLEPTKEYFLDLSLCYVENSDHFFHNNSSGGIFVNKTENSVHNYMALFSQPRTKRP